MGAKSEGNKKVVASGDVIHQLKGDYDIDDVISLFAQPPSVWKGVQSILGPTYTHLVAQKIQIVL